MTFWLDAQLPPALARYLIIWVTCGNATNKHLKQVFATTFAHARALLAGGAQVVEIADASADR